MVNSFAPILTRLAAIPDPRRAEGKRYEQRYILLFSILAIVTGADSYRGIATFIRTHFKRLNTAFELGWKRRPAHTSIRSVLIGLNADDVEAAFRAYAGDLDAAAQSSPASERILAVACPGEGRGGKCCAAVSTGSATALPNRS